MSAEDVLVNAAERGWVAVDSEMEKSAIMDMVKVFKGALLKEIRDDDVAGALAAVLVIRDGDVLGTGVVVVLADRALIGWMKGLLKKPVVEAVPLATITEVTRGVKEPTRRICNPNRAIFVRAAQDWELLCARTDIPDQPVYDLVAGLLGGTIKISDLQPVGDHA
ncbi:MAG TPA: hypothetical protein VI039_01730 [Solirubrobacterales bacterium]